MKYSRKVSAAVQNKSNEQLRADVYALEEIVGARRAHFMQLKSREDAVGEERLENSVGEEERLRARNMFLAKALKLIEIEEKRHAQDPRVINKKNAVRDVIRQIKEVEKDIDILQTVKKRRDKGLKEYGKLEAQARLMRGQLEDVANEQRTTSKGLQDMLRDLEVEDLELHERHAQLKERLQLGLSEKDVEDLKMEIVRQDEEIRELHEKETEWRDRKEGARDLVFQNVAKEKKEIAKLQRHIEKLYDELKNRDMELRKSAYASGNTAYATNI